MPPRITEQKSRRACECCRRKKTRCPGERPICSLCVRLNQTCLYLPRDQQTGERRTTRVSKSAATARVQELESRVSQIYDVLQSLANTRGHVGTHATVSSQLHSRGSSHSLEGPIGTSGSRDSPAVITNAWSPANPEPPAGLLDKFVEIYQTKIYFQPLPLLSPQGLRARIEEWPSYLRWSFFALCLLYVDDPFFGENKSQAIDFYTDFARERAIYMAVEGLASLESTQALCLLILGDIMCNKQNRAWMTIGTVSRIESFRFLRTQGVCAPSYVDAYSRCYWSIFTLEKAFSPTTAVLDYEVPLPPSPPLPPPVFEQAPEVDFAHADSEPGIVAPSLQIISIWGDIAAYMNALRLGKLEVPWSSNSTYSKLMVRLQEFEIDLGPPHRFENIHIKQRPVSEIHCNKEYWTPWTIMQLSSHAALAVLNHPFVHLVALRDRDGKRQPKLFLQQVIDQALFHTGWVIRLLQTFEEMQMEIHDPLLGYQVAATAIIPWLFQFAQDPHIAGKAREGLIHCERFLERLSEQWPHIRYKFKILRELHSAAEAGSDSSTITINTANFWKILDPNMDHGEPNDVALITASSSLNHDRDATLRITTKYVQPWTEEQGNSNVSNVEPPFFSSTQDIGTGVQVSLDDFFAQFGVNEGFWTQPNF